MADLVPTPVTRAARAVQAAQFAAIGYFASLTFPAAFGKRVQAPSAIVERALEHAWLHVATAHALIVQERHPGVELEAPQTPGREPRTGTRRTKARVATGALIEAAARGHNVTARHVVAPPGAEPDDEPLVADARHRRLPRQHPLQLPATFGRYRQAEHMPLLYVIDARLACLAVALEQTRQVLEVAAEAGHTGTPPGDFSLACVMSVTHHMVDPVQPGHPETPLGQTTDNLMKEWVDGGGTIAKAVFTFKPRGARGPYRSITDRARSLAGLDTTRGSASRTDVRAAVLEGELAVLDDAEPAAGANVLGTGQTLLDADVDLVQAGSGLGRLFGEDAL